MNSAQIFLYIQKILSDEQVNRSLKKIRGKLNHDDIRTFLSVTRGRTSRRSSSWLNTCARRAWPSGWTNPTSMAPPCGPRKSSRPSAPAPFSSSPSAGTPPAPKTSSRNWLWPVNERRSSYRFTSSNATSRRRWSTSSLASKTSRSTRSTRPKRTSSFTRRFAGSALAKRRSKAKRRPPPAPDTAPVWGTGTWPRPRPRAASASGSALRQRWSCWCAGFFLSQGGRRSPLPVYYVD